MDTQIELLNDGSGYKKPQSPPDVALRGTRGQLRCKTMSRLAAWLVLAVLLGYTLAAPLFVPQPSYEAEGRPLAVVAELGQRLAAHSRLQDAGDARLALSSRLEADPRLGLPSPQEIDAIKKVAQILVMLGEQVIPTIIGDFGPPPAAAAAGAAPAEDVPNDPVNNN